MGSYVYRYLDTADSLIKTTVTTSDSFPSGDFPTADTESATLIRGPPTYDSIIIEGPAILESTTTFQGTVDLTGANVLGNAGPTGPTGPEFSIEYGQFHGATALAGLPGIVVVGALGGSLFDYSRWVPLGTTPINSGNILSANSLNITFNETLVLANGADVGSAYLEVSSGGVYKAEYNIDGFTNSASADPATTLCSMFKWTTTTSVEILEPMICYYDTVDTDYSDFGVKLSKSGLVQLNANDKVDVRMIGSGGTSSAWQFSAFNVNLVKIDD